MGFVVQPCKCLDWSSFYLAFGFFPPIDFCCPSNNIKIVGILIIFISFSLFFLQDTFDKDVCHVDVLPRLGDVQITFEIFFQCFVQKTYLLCFFAMLLTFQHQLATFDMTLMKVFVKFVGQVFWITHRSPGVSIGFFPYFSWVDCFHFHKVH
jgi:hypothetical protein